MDAISYGSNIDSTDLNKRFEELQFLLAQAYRQNQELLQIVQTQNTAITGLNNSIGGAANFAGGFLQSTGFTYSGAADKVAFASFYEAPLYKSGAYVQPGTGSLLLNHNLQDDNRVPLVQRDGRLQLSDMVSVVVPDKVGIDTTARWLLEPNRFWCQALSDIDTLDISIQLPPTLSPEINYVLLENLFAYGVSHKVSYFDTYGNPSAVQGNSSAFYPVNGKRFGGKLLLRLKSTLKDSNGLYIFGLNNLKLGYRHYVSEGYAVNQIDLNHTDGNTLRIHTFKAAYQLAVVPPVHSDVVRFQIATALDGEDIAEDSIVYDSGVDPYPLTTSATAVDIDNCGTELYVKTLLKNNGNSPRVDGYYFEYETLA